ncbi:unnamed protein product [Caenorhabditis auriculariae]|uniref:Uncharacterized protein n=1 Tax=Caenorhabditis auriculariae TaxID=2777116 RepID=A0A8S1H1P7_9PELO|nr:unnamed protein product [Caenorhabditis auriculariae]
MRKLLGLLLLCAGAAARNRPSTYDSNYPSYIDQMCRAYCDKNPVLPKSGRPQFPPPPPPTRPGPPPTIIVSPPSPPRIIVSPPTPPRIIISPPTPPGTPPHNPWG